MQHANGILWISGDREMTHKLTLLSSNFFVNEACKRHKTKKTHQNRLLNFKNGTNQLGKYLK